MDLRVTDIKQYHYCQRIIFYNYVTPIPRVVTPKMEIGSESHKVEEILEKKRILKKYGWESGIRTFKVHRYSEELGLSGIIDMVITVEECEYPVEFKMSFREPMANAKFQVAAYAMLLVDKGGVPPQIGFILCIPTGRLYQVKITAGLQEKIKEDLNNIRSLIKNEKFPSATSNRNRCMECEFKNYCRDIY